MVVRDGNVISEIISDKSLTDKVSKIKRLKELENYFSDNIIKAIKDFYPKIYESLINI